MEGCLAEHGAGDFLHIVLAYCRSDDAIPSVIKPDPGDEVGAGFDSGQYFRRHPEYRNTERFVDLAATDKAPVALFELVAVDRVIKEIGEV